MVLHQLINWLMHMINIQIHTTWDILWYVKSIGLSVQKDDKTNFATSQRWVFAKDLCRSAWLRWKYSSLRNQLSNWKGQYLETSIRCQLLKPLKSQRVESSRVDLNGSLDNPSVRIGLPIWKTEINTQLSYISFWYMVLI